MPLASGISGSSVDSSPASAATRRSAYTRALGDDFLSANMAAYFFRDVPNSIARRSPYEDGAAVLEHALEEAVARDGGNLASVRCRRAASGWTRTASSTSRLDFGSRSSLNSVGADDACWITHPPRPGSAAAKPGDDTGVRRQGLPQLRRRGRCRSRARGAGPGRTARVPVTPHDHTCDPDATTTSRHRICRSPRWLTASTFCTSHLRGDPELRGGRRRDVRAGRWSHRVIGSQPLHERWPALGWPRSWSGTARGYGPAPASSRG